MALEADFIKLQNSPILSLFNMLLEIGKTKTKLSGSLWISRLNAAARMHGVSYSKLINSLSKKKKHFC
ncbi:MAG: hypothetical protein CM15mP11_12250 [Gammaproteobacteria bacterium]|nr:MAG: hypothetical protein CM15mP11_12250 [Gammaproteobacteria bacterium]